MLKLSVFLFLNFSKIFTNFKTKLYINFFVTQQIGPKTLK